MLIPKPLDVKTKLVIAIAFALWLATLACSVNVKDHEGDQKSKVDIETPVGGIHVSQDADAWEGIYARELAGAARPRGLPVA